MSAGTIQTAVFSVGCFHISTMWSLLTPPNYIHHYLIPPNRKRVESRNCLWHCLLCPSSLKDTLLQLQTLIICWLPCACQLNSRFIWWQIHHQCISLCWVSLMAHIKYRRGHGGNSIKPDTAGIQPKWKNSVEFLRHFCLLDKFCMCRLCGKQEWENTVIKGRH